MARYIGAKCRLCRLEGVKLFLKGEKCFTSKCAIEERNFIPGEHGRNRRPGKTSDYYLQLREKQKVKRTYGLLEKQFRKYYREADGMKGATGSNLLVLLETRLDSVVYKMGFAASRSEARQLVRHKHILVDGKKVNIPFFQVRPEQAISLVEKAKAHGRVSSAVELAKQQDRAPWIEVDYSKFMGRFLRVPERAELPSDCNELLIVELYSR